MKLTEDGVQEVPAEDVKRNLEGLGHVLLRGLGGLDGGSRGGLRLDNHPGRAGRDRRNGAPGEADRSRGEEGGTGEANFPGRRRGRHHGLSTDDGGLLGRRRRAGERHSPARPDMAPIAAMVVMIGPNVRLGPSGQGPGAAPQHFSWFLYPPVLSNEHQSSKKNPPPILTDEMANQKPRTGALMRP